MLKSGDSFPSLDIFTMGDEGPTTVNTGSLFAGKYVVLFGVPGAFTPGCSKQHLPGYNQLYSQFKESGVDIIACVSMNDSFVMQAWSENQGVTGKILMLSDDGSLRDKLGLQADLSVFGLGIRFKRFAMVIKNNLIQHVGVEKDKNVKESSASAMLDFISSH